MDGRKARTNRRQFSCSEGRKPGRAPMRQGRVPHAWPFRVLTPRGFTLIKLLVVITIILLIAAILFPVFAKVREKARQTTCASNLKQIGLAITQYATDYDDSLPPAENGGLFATSWRSLVFPYVKSARVFACPSNPYSGAIAAGEVSLPVSYAANETLMTIPPVTLVNPNLIQYPAQIFLVGESSGGGWRLHNPPNSPLTNPLCAVTGPGGCEYPEAGVGLPTSSTDLFAGHSGFGNWLFADGHCKAMNPTQTCQGVDMWDLNQNNSGALCSAALTQALADNTVYWSKTSTP